MRMGRNLNADLARLAGLAYHRLDHGGGWIRQFHKLVPRAGQHPDFPLFEKLREWVLTPISLWPANLDAIGHAAIEQLKMGKRLDPVAALIIEFLPNAPSDLTQQSVAQHEHHVRCGHYEHLIHADHKFNFKEQDLQRSSELKSEWEKIKSLFKISKYQDGKGIVRRHFVQERNFRIDWDLEWKKRSHRFYALFNTFCHRWNLYGMKRDCPMLVKMTVNITPYGTLIFVPAYWNFDAKRDLNWKSITTLHRSRGITKQGPKLAMNQLSRRAEALRARELAEQAKAKGIKGSARIEWVIKKLRWDPRTDPSRLRRLLKLK